MSNKKLQLLSLAFTLVAGSLFAGVQSAYACHEATGWCCVEHGCCYFENNQIKACFITQEA